MAHQTCGGVAGPSNQAEHDHKKHRLKRCSDTEAAQLRPIVDKQVAIAKKARRYGQHLRHFIPLHSRRARESASPSPSMKELPSPLPMPANCPLRAGDEDIAFGWLMNSTFARAYRDESSVRCGERMESMTRPSRIRANSTCCALQHWRL